MNDGQQMARNVFSVWSDIDDDIVTYLCALLLEVVDGEMELHDFVSLVRFRTRGSTDVYM
jgi:hypothetical protein